MCCNFEELVGKTFTKIEGDRYDSEIRFINDNEEYVLKHEQDCCESVYLEDVDGDLQALVGQEILEAYGSFNSGNDENEYVSSTWSFYTIRTMRDSVTIRFYGSSNGYYSETASLYKVR